MPEVDESVIAQAQEEAGEAAAAQAPPAPPPPPQEPIVAGTQEAAPAAPAPPATAPEAPVGAPPPEAAPPAGGTSAAPPAAPPVPSGPLPQPTAAPVPAPVTKVLPAEWPHAGYTGPQPWEAENPPALTQNHLMVSGGSAGAEVVELAAYLGALGYQTGIGDNPHAVYDSRLAGAVAQFSADYGCQEDPAVLRARTEDTVGPWLWEALVRAVHKKIAEAPAE